jgi:hypothetical protein
VSAWRGLKSTWHASLNLQHILLFLLPLFSGHRRRQRSRMINIEEPEQKMLILAVLDCCLFFNFGARLQHCQKNLPASGVSLSTPSLT